MSIRPRHGTAALCSGCHRPALSFDHPPERRFEFILLGGLVFFLYYSWPRVHCGACGVVAEELPWSDGRHQSTKAHILFLAGWARKLSWTEVAETAPPGTGCATPSSAWWTGACSIGPWSPSRPSAWMEFVTPRATST